MSDVRVTREDLLEEQSRTSARVARLGRRMAQLTAERMSGSDDDEHDPEGETLSSQWSMLAGLLDSARAHLELADRAIERFDSGTYGVCQNCQNEIPGEQLAARPTRERCVACST